MLRWPVHPTIDEAREADWEPFEISGKNPANASAEISPSTVPCGCPTVQQDGLVGKSK